MHGLSLYMCVLVAAASPSGVWDCQRSGPDSLTLTLEGVCPGRLSVAWEGATPDRPAGLLYADATGNFLISFEHCEGTILGLSIHGLRLVRLLNTGPDGAGELTGRAAPLACGGFLQLVVYDQRPCTTSNVVQIPR